MSDENGERIPHAAHILKVETGEVRVYSMGDCRWFGDFVWSDGNFCCDCNRELFFERAAGNEIDTEGCSDGRFLVKVVAVADGSVLYCEKGMP